MSDWKTYYLDNGVILRQSVKEQYLVIEYSQKKGHIEVRDWKILGTDGNCVYFILDPSTIRNFINVDIDPSTPSFIPNNQYILHRSTFDLNSYTIEQLYEVSLPEFMINFPHYVEFTDNGVNVRSLTSNEWFQCDIDSGMVNYMRSYYNILSNYRTFVLRDIFVVVVQNSIQRLTVHRYRTGELPMSREIHSDFEMNWPFIYNGILYSIRLNRPNVNHDARNPPVSIPVIMAIDISTMAIREISIPQLREHDIHDRTTIRFVSSQGVMHIDYTRKGNSQTFELQLAAPEIVSNERGLNQIGNAADPQQLNNQAKNGVRNNPINISEIEELRKANEDQQTRIEDLERKYKQLLLMVGRSASANDS